MAPKLAAAQPALVARVAVGVSGGARRGGGAPLRDRLQDPRTSGPSRCGPGLGKDFALLSGFLDYKAEFYNDAVDELRPLSDDAAFVARRPELLYYLGRAYYANASYVKAVDALERFIRSQTILDRPLLPASAGELPEATKRTRQPERRAAAELDRWRRAGSRHSW